MKQVEVELLHKLMVAVAAQVVAEQSTHLPESVKNMVIDRAKAVEKLVMETLIAEGK